MSTKRTHQLLIAAAVGALFLPSFLVAGPMGYGGDREGDDFTNFFGAFLYGPRIDPLWDDRTDSPDLEQMDRRIRVVQAFLGSAGADLIELREGLALGMGRQEYELAAFLAIREIGSYVNEFESPPQFYYGYTGRDQMKVALRWLDSNEVIGLYYFAPPNRQGVDHYAMLEGVNPRSGQLYLEERDRATVAARIALEKQLSTDAVSWQGVRRGGDNREEPFSIWRRRGYGF